MFGSVISTDSLNPVRELCLQVVNHLDELIQDLCARFEKEDPAEPRGVVYNY
jgi:hypothetical protein